MEYSLIIFSIGFIGFILNKKNLIILLLNLEVMILGASLLILLISLNYDDLIGQIIGLFLISIAGAESALGLGILVAYYRLHQSISI